MTPAQLRAARALVDMSQADVASAAKVGVSTVRNFEANRSKPVTNNLDAIRRVLEEAGVVFVAADEASTAGGEGVRRA